MTSPLSLLSLLGGADPAPQSQAPVDDPAAFAAALAAAIQLLQPTAPLAPAPVVVTLPTQTAEEPAEDAAQSETEAEPRPAGGCIEVELAQPIASRPVEIDGAAEIDPDLQVPVGEDAEPGTATTADPPEPACGKVKTAPKQEKAPAGRPEESSDRRPAAEGEIKQPWLPGQKRPVPQAAPLPAPERAPDKPSDRAPRVAATVAAPATRQASPIASRSPAPVAEPVIPQAVSQRSAPAHETVDDEAAADLPVVTRATAGKAEAPKARRASVPAPADTAPRQLDAPPPALSVPPQAVPQAATPTIRSQADQSPVPEGRGERPASTASTAPPPAEPAPSGELGPWGQAANARLASQLAEIMDGLDVREFKVELARRPAGMLRPSQPQAAGLTPEADAPAPPSDPARPAKPDAILAEPLLPGPIAAPKAETETAKPKPLAESAPADQIDIPAASKPVSAPATPVRTADNDLDTAVELPVTLPRRVVQRSAVPTLPVSRQELPQTDRSSRNATLAEPARQRERHEAPSDSAASVSGSTPSPAERVVARSEEGSARGTREARNLPQPDTGDNRPAGSADRVTLQVSDGDGRQTRIRVSVVGDQVRAVITPPDNESARQLEHRMDELQTALARQGYTATKVSIQAPAESGSEGMAGAGLAVSSSEARTTPGRDQPTGDQRQGRNPRDQQQSQGGGQQQRQSHGRNRDQGAEQRRREHP